MGGAQLPFAAQLHTRGPSLPSHCVSGRAQHRVRASTSLSSLSLADAMGPHFRVTFLLTSSGRCFPKPPPTKSVTQSPPSLLGTTPGLYKSGAAPSCLHLALSKLLWCLWALPPRVWTLAARHPEPRVALGLLSPSILP
jgi:hypothetical protein